MSTTSTLDGVISYEDFKGMAAEFFARCKATPSPTADQLHGGLRMLRIGYLSMDCEPMWQGSAVILLQLAEKRAFDLTGESI